MRLPLSIRSLVMLSIALVAGVCAAWAAREHIQGHILQLEEQARVPMVQRVVAAMHLSAGQRLTPDLLAVRQFPAAMVSSDSLAPERFSDLINRVLITSLRAGDVVLPVHATLPSGTPFSDRLASGRRAITMPVDAINSVSGLLEPGDLIDLYVSFDYRRRRITAPLLQGVLVLATGTRSEPSEQSDSYTAGYSTVTLDTSPEDAIKLVAARQSGTITALLRRPDDGLPTQKAVRGDLASILGVNAPMPVSNRTKNAPVIYGNRPIRSVAGLSRTTLPPQLSGLFDLPYTPELASAWRQASQMLEGNPGSYLPAQWDPAQQDREFDEE